MADWAGLEQLHSTTGFLFFLERSVTFYQLTKAGQGNNQVFWGPMLSLTDTDFQRPKAPVYSSHTRQLDNQWKHWGLSPSRLSESMNPSPSDLLSSGVCVCNDTQKHFGTLPNSSSKPTFLPHFPFQLLFSLRSSTPFCALMAPFLAYQNIQYFLKFHAFPIWEKHVVFLLTSPAPRLVAK